MFEWYRTLRLFLLSLWNIASIPAVRLWWRRTCDESLWIVNLNDFLSFLHKVKVILTLTKYYFLRLKNQHSTCDAPFSPNSLPANVECQLAAGVVIEIDKHWKKPSNWLYAGFEAICGTVRRAFLWKFNAVMYCEFTTSKTKTWLLINEQFLLIPGNY